MHNERYDREYREYQKLRTRGTKKKRRGKKNTKLGKFTRVWALLYLVLFVLFGIAIVSLGVLPAKLLLTIIGILGLLSYILFLQLYVKNVKKWAKFFAITMSTLLMVVYSMGIAYSLGTMNFLDNISIGSGNASAEEVTEHSFNVYITGMDVYGEITEPGRSDVNMLVTVNPVEHRILLTSIPRDYRVNLAEHDDAVDKLTHTGFESVECTTTAVEEMLDEDIDYYFKVNFSTIIAFVDAIDGVDVVSDYDFNTYDFGTEDSHFTFQKGTNHLDGMQAMAFARERHAFADGDNQRIKNQQKVFSAVLEKTMSSKTLLLKYNDILSNIGDYVETDMSSRQIRALVKLQLKDMPDWEIETQTLTGIDSTQITYTGGDTPVYVMEQDKDSIREAKEKIDEVASDGFDEDGNPIED